ncbi:catalase [Melaminivora jejuensis]|uniref:catalase n=1 Tax=Melaminivora jejuensis TaxID=1267217 RepID=UPI002D7E6B0B|nr:catalase [Melaminivora jejuensis]
MPRLAGPPPRAATPPDTQLLRLGGPNFHEIPINAPIVQVHNNQRDGFHRQAIFRGRVAYEPNSLAGAVRSRPAGRALFRWQRATRRARARPRCAPSPKNSPSTTPRRDCSWTARRLPSRSTLPPPSASS